MSRGKHAVDLDARLRTKENIVRDHLRLTSKMSHAGSGATRAALGLSVRLLHEDFGTIARGVTIPALALASCWAIWTVRRQSSEVDSAPAKWSKASGLRIECGIAVGCATKAKPSKDRARSESLDAERNRWRGAVYPVAADAHCLEFWVTPSAKCRIGAVTPRHYSCVSSSGKKVCLFPMTRVAPGEGSLSAWMWRVTEQPETRTST